MNKLRSTVPRDAKVGDEFVVPYEKVKDTKSTTTIWLRIKIIDEHSVEVVTSNYK